MKSIWKTMSVALILFCALGLAGFAEGAVESSAGAATVSPSAGGAVLYPVTIEDDLGQQEGKENRRVVLEAPVERIVVAEKGCALALIKMGVADKAVGVSEWIKNDIPEFPDVPSIGGGNVDVELVIGLAPDVVVNLVGHNDKSDSQIIGAGIDVYTVGTVRDLDHIKEHISEYGLMFGTPQAAQEIIAEMNAKEAEAREIVQKQGAGREKPTVFMFGPLGDKETLQTWAPAGETIVEDLIEKAGGSSLAAEQGLTGWAQYSVEKLLEADPDVIILPFGEWEFSSVEEFTSMDLVQDLNAVKTGRVYGIDKTLVWDLSYKNATALVRFAEFINE
jgi:iron complex transport system substrate-binding protein